MKKRRYRLFLPGAGLAVAAVAGVLLIPAGRDTEKPVAAMSGETAAAPVPSGTPIPEGSSGICRRICAAGGNSAERLKLVEALSDRLEEEDRRRLADYIRSGENNDIEYVIKNNVMNRLRAQKEAAPELSEMLIDIARDRKQDVVVRAYAVQHMRPWYEVTRDPALKQAFLDLLEERDSEISGGALLALRRLSEQYPQEFDAAWIGSRAAGLAGDSGAHVLSRVSALQVATLLRAPETADAARRIVVEGSGHTALRLAALAALGELGSWSDLPLLQELDGGRPPLSGAARTAAAKLMKRQKNNI
ncbi:MAG: hypothetical protein HP002_15175 [Lentisphaeria bacterium]|nr:hypothetical protein [Lentisphaeria bacterium]